MNPVPAPGADEIRTTLLELLVRVAPDIDPSTVIPSLEFRDQFDFDSMDLFHFALAVHERFGIELPESDYRELLGLDRAVAYLQSRVS